MATKVGIIGSGVVGQTLAKGFLKHGYDVTIGSNDQKKGSISLPRSFHCSLFSWPLRT
jgi:predicted dinucleotide-binding enzyme